jgi:hypothetical protein
MAKNQSSSKNAPSKSFTRPHGRPGEQRIFNPALKNQLQGFVPNRNRTVMRKLFELAGDGVDHINIYKRPKTELGRIISVFSEDRPFNHPFFGHFSSRQGMFFYLQSPSGDDAYRTMSPVKMSHHAFNSGEPRVNFQNIKYFMAEALWLQIKDDEKAIQLFKDNQLPFEAYFTKKQTNEDGISKILTRPNIHYWLVEAANIISDALKADEVPDFSRLVENKAALENLKAKIFKPRVPKSDQVETELDETEESDATQTEDTGLVVESVNGESESSINEVVEENTTAPTAEETPVEVQDEQQQTSV